jgi:hypothetical protein
MKATHARMSDEVLATPRLGRGTVSAPPPSARTSRECGIVNSNAYTVLRGIGDDPDVER